MHDDACQLQKRLQAWINAGEMSFSCVSLIVFSDILGYVLSDQAHK